jgi:hypothetical protein
MTRMTGRAKKTQLDAEPIGSWRVCPSTSHLTNVAVHFKLQLRGTKGSCVRLRQLLPRRFAVKALISPLFCASTALDSDRAAPCQPHARNLQHHQAALGRIGADRKSISIAKFGLTNHVGDDDKVSRRALAGRDHPQRLSGIKLE